MHPILERLQSDLDALRMTARSSRDVTAWMRDSGNAFAHATRALRYGDSYEVDDRGMYGGQVMLPERSDSVMRLTWAHSQVSDDNGSDAPHSLAMTVVISTQNSVDLPAVLAAIAKPQEFVRSGRAVFPTGTAHQWMLEWAATDWSWAATRCLCHELRKLTEPERGWKHRPAEEISALVKKHLPNLSWETFSGLAQNGLLPPDTQQDETLAMMLWERGRGVEQTLINLPTLG